MTCVISNSCQSLLVNNQNPSLCIYFSLTFYHFHLFLFSKENKQCITQPAEQVIGCHLPFRKLCQKESSRTATDPAHSGNRNLPRGYEISALMSWRCLRRLPSHFNSASGSLNSSLCMFSVYSTGMLPPQSFSPLLIMWLTVSPATCQHSWSAFVY